MAATTLARAGGVTAVWFDGRVLSAWYDDTGDPANLFLATALTGPPGPSDPAPAAGTSWPGEAADAANDRRCGHGLPPHLCMVCGAHPDGGLVGG